MSRIDTIKIDPEGDREGWLALRKQDVTASVAGALLGVYPYASRYALWMMKSGKASEDKAETAAMVRGRVLEKPALDLLAIDRPTWKIWQPNVYLRDPEIRMGATPDAYAIDPRRKGFGNVQVKTVAKQAFKRSWHNDEGEIDPPLWIVVQAIQEAYLSGAKWACIVAFIMDVGLEIEIIDVPIHQGVIDRLRNETRAFWQSIAENNPPEPDYGQDGALIAGLYTEDNGREIDLSGDNMLPVILAEREEIKERMRADSARVSEIETEIIAKIGEHERAYLPGWYLRRPIVERRGFFVDPTSYRKLAIKKNN